MNKKVLKNILKVFMIIGGIIVILFIAFIIYLGFSKTNASDVEWSYSIKLNVLTGKEDIQETLQETAEQMTREKEELYSKLNWYDSLEEAVQDDGLLNSETYQDYALKSVYFLRELEDRCIVFYTIPNEANNKQTLISYILFFKDNNKFSQPYMTKGRLPVPGWGDRSLYYDCDDAVVDYIIFELKSDSILDNDKIQMFYGTWPDKDELESLTLSGIPLEILEEPLELNGTEYYFWYLTDLSWCEKLQEIHWSKFTYADVIELLDVQYTPTETK